MKSENTGASGGAPRSAQKQSIPWWDAGGEASTDQFDTEFGGVFEGDPIWDDGHQNMPHVGHDQSLNW